MQSLAQKKARENFKKAIEYRKKTGCSLKQAFAHVSGKKTVVKKKATPKKVAVKKAAKKVVKKKVGVVKKKAAKKPSEKNILSKIHKVKKDVDNLDEAQHKHMSIGSVKHELIEKLMHINKDISNYNNRIENIKNALPYKDKYQKVFSKEMIKNYKNIISELKTHSRELKKHI